MQNYPLSILNQNKSSIFGKQLKGDGVKIDLSDKGSVFDKCDVKDQEALQKYADKLMQENATNWAFSDFGERRERFFRELDAKQMVEEKRFYHLGLDVWVDVDTELFAPLDGTVAHAEYEEGFGNYGGFVLLKHSIAKEIFYSFYGHLNPNTLPAVGTELKSGESIARLGDMTQNGGYFFHTHVQVLTQKGYQEGFLHKGYVNDEVFSELSKFVLDPVYLVV